MRKRTSVALATALRPMVDCLRERGFAPTTRRLTGWLPTQVTPSRDELAGV